MKKILILAANPTDTKKLRLDKEIGEIQNAHRQARYREEIEIIPKLAVRVEDLQNELLYEKPNIVHFSGHGAGDDGLILENRNGLTQFVSSQALAGLFELCKDYVECVVLNACYTEVQAKAIYQHINCVVGMDKAIGDEAAINFAVGFYRAFMNGESYQKSFDFGCNAIDLQNIPESQTPKIKIRDNSKNIGTKNSSNGLSLAQRLEKERLEKDLAARQKDYEAVTEKLRWETNPITKNSLEADLQKLIDEIKQLEHKLNQLE